jgi:hypothetical protein
MAGFLKWIVELFAGPKPTQIKVRINFAKDGNCWSYDLEADDHVSDPYVKAGNKIDFPHSQPTSIIEFRLQGKAGQVLDFDLDPNLPVKEPIWVESGQCPTQCNPFPSDFSVVRKSPNVIEVQNRNLNAGDFHYRLNFVDSGGNKVHWDPIIRNGGGGGP